MLDVKRGGKKRYIDSSIMHCNVNQLRQDLKFLLLTIVDLFFSNTLQQNNITLSALRQRHGHFIFMYI